MNKLEKFRQLGLSENTLEALKHKGFEEPTPIQEKTIPLLLEGKCDIVGQAQTGTGKTAAFGLPILERIHEGSKTVQALILTPTRELAIQVAEEINSLKGHKKLRVLPVYGGQSIELQLKRLKQGIDIVVGTPGRIIDHINRKTLKLNEISYMVLDEADEMLNMGFIEDVELILAKTNPDKRVLLFSATMPKEILSISKKYMKNYEVISVKKENLTVDLIDQIYFEVRHSNKFEALCRIIDIEEIFYGLVFCRTKVDVDNVANHLVERGYDAGAIHGDMSQSQRENILSKFKRNKINILVATDVAARGIDIENLTHVVNYSSPQDPDSYIHRIGRTGRAGKGGTAITFVTPDEYRKLAFIKRITKADIRKEKIPKVEDIIKAKKLRIKTEIDDLINSETHKKYANIAESLLEENDPLRVVCALLEYAFSDDLDEAGYGKISEGKGYGKISEGSVDGKGKTRLFVARGKTSGMDPKKLVDFIRDETRVRPDRIREVKVFENFSFITVPFREAEIILNVFKNKKRGKRSIVEKAKESQ